MIRTDIVVRDSDVHVWKVLLIDEREIEGVVKADHCKKMFGNEFLHKNK